MYAMMYLFSAPKFVLYPDVYKEEALQILLDPILVAAYKLYWYLPLFEGTFFIRQV